jgi:PTS system mannose-specific IIA component
MARLLILAHAPLATALHTVACHAFPELAAHVSALDVEPNAPADQVERRARGLLAPGGETLVLTDVFGATPANVAQRLADAGRVRVVAGVNVPMLWRALNYAALPLDDLVARTLVGGTQGVMAVATAKPQNQVSPPSHDPQQHHHQQ